MSSNDRLLNQLLKAIEEHNRSHENKITPLQALKMYLRMTKAGL